MRKGKAMKKTKELAEKKRMYTVVAYNPNSYHYRNGVRICEDHADCGHRHKTIEATGKCSVQMSTWNVNIELRDENWLPLPDEAYYAG